MLEGIEGGGDQIDPPTRKSALKNPSLIKVEQSKIEISSPRHSFVRIQLTEFDCGRSLFRY